MTGIAMILRKTASRLRSDESGAMTVESVLWVPFYMMFFALIADASLMFHSHAQATRIVHDANRQASYGTFTKASDVESAVKTRIGEFSPNATVDTVLGPNVVSTTVTMPASDIAAVGVVGALVRGEVTVSLIHLVES